ncbi:smoothelin isoform X2 [Ambystoma mexicanum]|uniref:smoothelin isoform X2 n=1 Tax=Ambystoma mexicanum TaxID=8296 RepID=UPI0037E7112B
MSEERYSSMDEGTLRTLLEATLDLAERRQIRTAIRELRRKELEGYEEALASKRFRSEKSSERQENKENCPRSQEIEKDQMKTLALPLGKLEAIKDVEELTTLLRTASEYEERKLIRAAIRKLRNEEIEAMSTRVGRSRERDIEKPASGQQENHTDVPSSLIPEREDQEERLQIRSQIHELRNCRNQESNYTNSKEHALGLFPYTPTSEQLSSSTSGPATSSESTDLCFLTTDSETDPEDSSTCRVQPSCQTPGRKNSHDSMSGDEDNESAKATANAAFNEEVPRCGDIGKESVASVQVSINNTGKNLLQTAVPDLHSTHQSSKLNNMEKSETSKASVTPSVEKTATVSHTRDHAVDLSPFRRANSLRDSAQRFTAESTEQPTSFGNRSASQRGESRTKGNRILQQQQQLLQAVSPAPRSRDSPVAALSNTRGWTPGRQGLDHLQQNRQDLASRKDSQEKQKPHSETDGAAQSKPALKATSTEDQRHRTGSHKGAFVADTGGKSSSTKKEGAESSAHQNSQGHILVGRSKGSQSEGSPVTSQCGHIENDERSLKKSEDPSSKHPTPLSSFRSKPLYSSTSQDSPVPAKGKGRLQSTSDGVPAGSGAVSSDPDPESNMKTLLTIEIKDGRNQPASSRIIGAPGSQRAEVTLGLRSSPFTVTTSRSSSNAVKVETESTEQKKPAELLPNGTEKTPENEPEKRSTLNVEELSRIEEEEVLDKMLDKTTDFEERRLIRTAMRELRQRKRDQREKERDQRLQELKSKSTDSRTPKGARSMETTVSQSAKSADGSSVSTLTKTQRLVQSNDGNKTSRTTMVESSYMKRSDDGGTIVQTKASFSSTSKKVGSIFDREEDPSSRASNQAALERRQAERKMELMKAQNLPKTSATQARKAMIDKLEKESGSPGSPAFSRVAVTPTSGFGVPNASSIKQMLLDWCKAKTRGYENVNIQNFSSSWSDGMAFCALVHNFFPEAFDFSELNPQNRRKNFDLAFSSAEKHADCPQLLDVNDMVRMREPDWKCVYTYIQEFYRCLVQKGLVKTKQS